MISRSKPFISCAALAALAALLGAVLIVPDADARRLGGGKSLGRQSADAGRQEAQPAAREALRAEPSQAVLAQTPATPGQPAPGSELGPIGRRLGPIGGVAVALGITALLSHLGLVGPLAELLAGALTIGLPALAAMILWRVLRGPPAPRPAVRRLEPALNMAQVTGIHPGSVADTTDARSAAGTARAMPAALRARGVPLDFDVQAFLRTAKVHFLRLQTAWGARNLSDISQFTTPQIFAELRMPFDEEGEATHRSEVVKLEAELLGLEEGPEDWLARVRFSGMVREHPADPVRLFQEIWNLSKRKQRGAGWLLAGIQQLR